MYSNINLSLCRTILEVVTDRHYEDYVRAELLQHAQASDMRLSAHPARVALAYKSWEQPRHGTPIADDFRDSGAAYGWYGTVEELMRFLLALRNNVYLDATATRDMFESGLGWGVRRTLAGKAFTHDGQWVTEDNRGVRTGIAVFPDKVDASAVHQHERPVLSRQHSCAWNERLPAPDELRR